MTKQDIVDHLNPIGSGYMTTSDTDDPNVNLGGVWKKIPGDFFININTGDLVVNNGDNFTSSTSSVSTSSVDLSESQSGRHSHLVPTLENGVSGSKQLLLDPHSGNYDNAKAKTLGDANFNVGPIYGSSHSHSMSHNHTYDPIHINVYLWKRIG